MKKVYTLLAAVTLISSASNAQETWDDFDNPEQIVYSYYDGTTFDENFSNPVTTGANSSAVCARYVRNNAVLYDVIVIDPAGTNVVDTVTDYVTGAKNMTIQVFSPGPGYTVQITLENSSAAMPTNYPTGRHSEYTATTTASNAWETLTFSHVNTPDATVSDGDVNRMVILFEPNTNNSTIWVWDNLMGPEFVDPCAGTTPDPTIGDNFECQRNITYTFSNGNYSTVGNPMNSGNNISASCGFFQKWPPPTNDGAFGGDLDMPFTSDTYNLAQIDLYSPAAPQDFLLILQDANGNNLADTTFTTSSTTDWETFDLYLNEVPTATQIAGIVLLLDPSTATEDSIYLDNIRFSFDSTVSIEEYNLSAKTQIFPVPFKNEFTVSSEDVIENIVITDITGKVIYQQAGLNSLSTLIETSQFNSGIYMIRVQNADGHSFTRKLIKE